MISGNVSNRHALVPVTFRLMDRPDLTIEFVVDTGFTDYLCLPPEAVAVLGLPYQYDEPANLADNSEVLLPVHEATILWNGQERTVGGSGDRPASAARDRAAGGPGTRGSVPRRRARDD